LREDGFTNVSAADVEEVRRGLRAGQEPSGLIGRAIARQLRLLKSPGPVPGEDLE